tara:strand:+ start:1685 stop:2155 length:471 start_codon:yes stop_codon:yes gene_type:complete
MSQWKVKTEIKESNIEGAGSGRFFCSDYPKGTIVRKQNLSNPNNILKFSNEKSLKFEDLNTLVHFGHSKPIYDKQNRHKNVVFLNVPFMNTNHSKFPNIKYHFTKHNKYTILIKNVKKGDEMLQDYASFSQVQWFENYLNKSNVSSCRELGVSLNM